MIIYISDFDAQGSGYRTISVPLCEELVERGHEVLVFGLGYKGEQHNQRFRICPARFTQLPSIISLLPTDQSIKIEAWVVALDIPLQLRLMGQIPDRGLIPWVGIFPIESDPLCATWAMRLWEMNSRLVISEFGQRTAMAAGLECTHLPIGIDSSVWNPLDPAQRTELRAKMDFADKFVVLTVADNQERKHLSAGMEIVGKLKDQLDVVWILVTRPDSPVGWVLGDLAEQWGMTERCFVFKRGMPHEQLRELYGIADAFLLPSKAEGLGLPVLEAMTMRIPVVGTKCTALEDHLKDRRGFLIEPSYTIVDPWGNSKRYMIGIDEAVSALVTISTAPQDARNKMLDRASEYVKERVWSRAGDVLEEAINGKA